MTVGLARIVLLAPALALLPCGPAAATTPPRSGPPPTVTIVEQTFEVEVGSPLTLDLRFSGTPGDDDQLFVDLSPVTRRADLRAADRPVVDSVTVRLSDLAGDGPTRRLVVPTEATEEHDDTLTIDAAGVYALDVALADQQSPTLTFIHVNETADPETTLPVAVVVGLGTSVDVDDLGVAHLSPAALGILDDLIGALDACDAPVAVHLPAGTIAALAEHPDVRDRLATALGNDELISEPILPLDPSTMAATARSALYTQWLGDGEDAAITALRQPARRLVAVAGDRLSAGGATLRRDLGNRLLLFTTQQFDALPSTPGAFFDSSRVVRIATGSGTGLDGTTPDRAIAARLSATDAPPATTGAGIAAELLMIRNDILAAGGTPSRRGVLVAPADLTVIPAAVLRTVCATVSRTTGLRAVSVDDLVGRVDPVLVNEQPLTLDLATVDAAPAPLEPPAGERRAAIRNVATMLPSADPRPGQWDRALDVLPSTALDAAAMTRIVTGVDNEIAALTAAVVPPSPFNATLGSRTATLRLNFTNNGATPLKIRLHLSAGANKITFPDNDRVYELPAAAATQIPIPIEARSNGRIPVTVQVLTPQGDTQVSPALPLTLTVNGIAGLGYLLTGAGALVLVTWWVRHHRRLRAARRAATSTLPDP